LAKPKSELTPELKAALPKLSDGKSERVRDVQNRK
jgi:hypothetical protein